MILMSQNEADQIQRKHEVARVADIHRLDPLLVLAECQPELPIRLVECGGGVQVVLAPMGAAAES